ncbi:MAG: hypothetical protein AAF721_13810 [Myxococcota bacterium]
MPNRTLLLSLCCVAALACDDKSEPKAAGDAEPAKDGTKPEAEPDPAKAAADDSDPCQLGGAEFEALIGGPVTDKGAQGNWGIASTCDYTTKDHPVAASVSTVTGNLDSDRAMPGGEDVSGVGEAAIWNATTGSFAAKKGKHVVRVRVGAGDKTAKKAAASAIAKMALTRL